MASISFYYIFHLLINLSLIVFPCCYGIGSFSFDIHHRYSDAVREIFPGDGLPEKGTIDYYKAMVHRDQFLHSRRRSTLEDDNIKPSLTFLYGNETYRINALGFLHYANVTVGTPAKSYLVALDTGSDLFWLPCDCVNCVAGVNSSSGEGIKFDIYSPKSSLTSKEVPCSSSLCEYGRQCILPSNRCPYQVAYLSNNTSSTGYLVEDILHLTTNDDKLKVVDAKITLGCGKEQSGAFLDSAAPNGLFGLGIKNISVPSILANEGLTSNSFSLCFGPDGMGRIEFGDKGSSGQSVTPFNLGPRHPTYNISITQINVGGNVSNLDFTTIFDSGTSFTYLNDPAYSIISNNFDAMVKEKRYSMESRVPFEYCYELSPNQTSVEYPVLNLTMKGGEHYFVNHPLILFASQMTRIYCLAIARSRDVNIIGQNFMSGYHIVFDRERMVLGWKESNCYDVENTNDLPISPSLAPATGPATAIIPQANSNINDTSQTEETPKSPHNRSSTLLNSVIFTFLMILVPFLALA